MSNLESNRRAIIIEEKSKINQCNKISEKSRNDISIEFELIKQNELNNRKDFINFVNKKINFDKVLDNPDEEFTKKISNKTNIGEIKRIPSEKLKVDEWFKENRPKGLFSFCKNSFLQKNHIRIQYSPIIEGFNEETIKERIMLDMRYIDQSEIFVSKEKENLSFLILFLKEN